MSLVHSVSVETWETLPWFADVENKLFGPHVGMRWARRTGRWTLRTGGSFFAALNVRDAGLNGTLGFAEPSNQIINTSTALLNPATFSKHDSDVEFSPVAEARIEAILHLTRKASIRVGYTGTYAAKIGRGSQVIGYTFPELSLLPPDGNSHYSTHGANFGFEINH